MSLSSLVPHKVVVCRNSRKGGRLRPAARGTGRPRVWATSSGHFGGLRCVLPLSCTGGHGQAPNNLWALGRSSLHQAGFSGSRPHSDFIPGLRAQNRRGSLFLRPLWSPLLLSPTFPPAEVVYAVCQRWPDIFACHRCDPWINASAVS